MPFDFSADSTEVLEQFSNCTVQIGVESCRGIFDRPDKQAGGFGELVAGFDPQVAIGQRAVNAYGIMHNSNLTIILDSTPDQRSDFVVKSVNGDDSGMALCMLKKA